MFVGFLYVISAMSLRYASVGDSFIPDTYATVGNAIKMLHLFMFLEVLHPFFGYTKVGLMNFHCSYLIKFVKMSRIILSTKVNAYVLRALFT